MNGSNLGKATVRAASTEIAEVAQLVEHNLAKVRAAGSSPVFRSRLMVKCDSGRLFLV